MMNYKLALLSTNRRHTRFAMFDATGANCGEIVVETSDVPSFIKNNWTGDVYRQGQSSIDNGKLTFLVKADGELQLVR